jgi:hypothetical protein
MVIRELRSCQRNGKRQRRGSGEEDQVDGGFFRRAAGAFIFGLLRSAPNSGKYGI